MDCTLQVSAALEKQVRAKEKELIAFQEEYKIRVKVSKTCLEGSSATVHLTWSGLHAGNVDLTGRRRPK